MLVIPAIDIKGGNVVRLRQGKADDVTVYSDSPVAMAREWVKQGAEFLHVVDLDGAFSGTVRNIDHIKAIIKAVPVPVECGGGIRDKETIKELLQAGVHRVVLGTKAVEDRIFLQETFDYFRDRVIVSIDARKGVVLTKGWCQATSKGVVPFVRKLKEMGFSRIIYTDVTKDGMLAGPNIMAIASLLQKTGMGVIASGGVSSAADIRKLAALEPQGVSGVIIGKALYEDTLSLSEARKAAENIRAG